MNYIFSHLNPGWVTAFFAFGAQAVVVFRWLHRYLSNRRRESEVNRKFVRDMATNHLPHIYQALSDIADNQGVELREPPEIQFDLSAEAKRWDRG